MSASHGRIAGLDALRGFAIFGILLINIQVFSGYGFLGTEGRAALAGSAIDAELPFYLEWLVRERFYSLFSLLFGYSFFMLAQRAGSGALSVHLRRMGGLLLIGLLHGVFLWPWDILLLYALMGVLLSVFLQRSTVTLFTASVLLLMLTGVLRWYGTELGLPAGRGPLARELLQTHVPRFNNGSYGEVVVANAWLNVAVALGWLEDLRPLRVLMLFLLGAAAASLQLARPGSGGLKLLFASALVGLAGGLGLGLVETRLTAETVAQELLLVLAEVAAAPLLAVGYGATLILWWRGDHLLSRLTRGMLAPVGRMALSNYILQSAVFVPLFYGFGAGWYGGFSLSALMMMAAGFFLLQMMVSALWLALFRQGPLEWLWRWQVQGARPRFVR